MSLPIPISPDLGPGGRVGAEPEPAVGPAPAEGLSQGRIVVRRFVRHRGAMLSCLVLIAVVLLAATSIGWGPIPGWWKHTPTDLPPVANPGGAPTLSFSGGLAVGDHPFGQDNIGRDVFARVMRGTQQSLVVMVVIGLLATIIGVLVGAVAGYRRGRIDDALMRLTDMVITIPVIMIGAILGHWVGGASPLALAVALALVTWTSMARLVRGEFLALREREFVDAARVAGARAGRIMFRHMLPNAVGPIIVNTTLLMASAILLETALSYLGFGVRAPDVSLGTLIADYQTAFATRPWLFWWPGMFIVLIALCVNFIGDGLRDAFDPRQLLVASRRATARPEPITPGAPLSGDEPLLEVRGLGVDFLVDDRWVPAAIDLTYELRSGEVLAIVGESGSGKTQSSMALLGLLPPNARVRGSARLAGRELVGLTHEQLSAVRGKGVAVIFQEPMAALNPVYTVGFQIMEAVRAHDDPGPRRARERATELLALVGMPEPRAAMDRYPHQLSGGQRQRAMIAQALAGDPSVLIADEPTTALDVTVQAEILEVLRDLRGRIDSGVLLITHDMGVVADLADRVIVMSDGVIVESGEVTEVFHRPRHAYTQQLLAAVPRLGASAPRTGRPAERSAPPVILARDLVVSYPRRGRVPALRAVDGIDLVIGEGEVVGLVGESGSGKTTVGRAVVGLLPVASGSLTVGGVDLASTRARDLDRTTTSIVFQDPGASLNPRLPVGESVGEPLRLHRAARGLELQRRVDVLLDQVHLSRSTRNRYPHELSGGQRQRAGIARALALSPRLLVADEPTSALDVSVQARVLELFADLQREHGFACLFISHDLAVVEMLAERIAVMHEGRIVEQGPAEQGLGSPQDAYTRRLLAAVPVPDPTEQRLRREDRRALRG